MKSTNRKTHRKQNREYRETDRQMEETEYDAWGKGSQTTYSEVKPTIIQAPTAYQNSRKKKKNKQASFYDQNNIVSHRNTVYIKNRNIKSFFSYLRGLKAQIPIQINCDIVPWRNFYFDIIVIFF